MSRRVEAALVLVLALIVAAAYLNSLRGVFVFDDETDIVSNTNIRSILAPWGLLRTTNRPVIQYSFAMNYAFGGLSPVGFHVVNLFIHLTNVVLAYRILCLTFRSPRLMPSLGSRAAPLAFVAALLWGLHPLNTSAVTYLVHRYESGMAMFFLGVVYCTLCGSTARRAAWWYVAAFACYLLALGSKEVAVVIPVVLLAFDRIFLSKDWPKSGENGNGFMPRCG